ncbi:MAG TPA: LysM peptidoglycan-binding domain-containing protein [Rariglobus sp.]|jgi:LysM repeat protein|nr:LysM peptidoglycan-binding domain-containing protein [Rariglobus sp.]
MKILKIFGLVVAVHAAVFMFIFAIPGCRSTGKQKAAAAAGADTGSPVASTGPDMASPVSAGTDNTPPQVLFSPTRPGTAAAAAVEAQAPADVQPVSAYTVVKGDNLWSIAKKNGTTVKELAAANNIQANSSLHLGQKLIIPGKAPVASATASSSSAGSQTLSYTVKSGDTLSSIARHAGSNKAAIRTLNKLKSDVVRVDQVLVLPAGGASAPAPAAEAAAPAAQSGSSLTHVVKAGDTLGSIARKYQVKVGDIAAANNIADPTKIRVGQKLKIPGWQAPAAAKTSAPAPAAPAPTFDVSPVAPATDSPISASPAESGSPLVAPAPDASADAPVIKIEDSGAPTMN